MKNSGAGVRVEALTSRVFDRDDMRRIALRERARIRATLSTLDEEQWSAPSLCEGWTVRDVAAHLAHNTRAGLYHYLAGLAAVGFNHAEYHRRATVEWTKRPTGQLVGALGGTQMRFTCRRHPSWCVVDFVVHHQDIRRPLGLGLDVPEGSPGRVAGGDDGGRVRHRLPPGHRSAPGRHRCAVGPRRRSGRGARPRRGVVDGHHGTPGRVGAFRSGDGHRGSGGQDSTQVCGTSSAIEREQRHRARAAP